MKYWPGGDGRWRRIQNIFCYKNKNCCIFGLSMKTCLLSWIGKADLAASRGEARAGLGPIGQAVKSRDFKEIVLLTDFPEKEVQAFVSWLEEKTPAKIAVRRVKLTSP